MDKVRQFPSIIAAIEIRRSLRSRNLEGYRIATDRQLRSNPKVN